MPMTRLNTFTITRFVASNTLPITVILIVLITLMSFVQLPSPMLMFTAECANGTDIYLFDMRVQWAFNITRNQVRNVAPSWSPDGSQIAFVSYQISQPGLYIMNADGSNLHFVASNLEGNYGLSSWSPDGTRLAVSYIEWNSDDGYTLIFDMTSEGVHPIIDRIDDIAQPLWSPDGITLAFVSNHEGNNDIYLMDLTSGDVRNLTQNPAEDHSPAWSPDGTEIAFISDRRLGTAHIFRINIDTSEVQQITPTGQFYAQFYSQPAWSEDGSRIAFVSIASRTFFSDLFVIPADGALYSYQITNTACSESYLSWRP